ncbi:MAG: nucleoside triphosphate pyrophosphohydrolase [Planctomycetes bacterium]|nr:nucleoside triphosphate pyrophosphohydrolase [Planctomycetota bacterium]
MSEPAASTRPTRPLEPLRPTGDARLDGLAKLLAIVDRLRAADGCPWDLEQTVRSMAPSLIEEGYELLEAIERGDERGAVEEAGDLLMVVVLICKIAEQERRFDLAAVGEAVADKLVRRHPHVFGDATVRGSAHAIANWEKIKEAERKEKREDASALAGVPVALPALQRAHRIGAKAVSAGFRWTDEGGAFEKLDEECAELREAYALPAGDTRRAQRIEAELGDVLVAAAFLGNYLGIDPERAAREALRRFELRFRAMEGELGGSVRGKALPELMAAWGRAKRSTGTA